MSLRRHIAANYASQIYVAAVGILVTPLYLSSMGVEAYGLIGFFATLQVWFLLLDAGISPAVAREIARHRGGAPDAVPVRSLVNGAERVFVVIGLLGGGVVAAAAGLIAQRWLHVQTLALAEVTDAIRLMAFISGLRLLASLYRAGIGGFERLAWLGGFNAVVATARAFLALPALAWMGGRPVVYFGVQLFIAIVEVGLLARELRRSVGKAAVPVNDAPVDLRRLGQFSATVAATSLLYVALGQSDRLLLSTLLTLEDYATFTLATLAASAISLASGPLGAVFTPRLARVASGDDRSALLAAYRLGLRLMSLAVFPAAFTLALYAEPLLRAWTDQASIASAAAPVLVLYALGNALAALAMVPYLLQFALGQLRWHVAGSVGILGLLIPGQWWLTLLYGASGAGAFWIAVNAAWLLLWLPFVHRRLLPTVRWWPAMRDVLLIVSVSALSAAIVRATLPLAHFDSRALVAAGVAFAWSLCATAAALCLPEVRSRLRLRQRPLPGA